MERTPSISQETSVIADEHLGLDLFQSLKDNAYNNDQRSTAEGYAGSEHTIEYKRNGHNDDQTDRTDKDDVVQDLVQVILSQAYRDGYPG